MKKKADLTEIILNGTPKQRALLIVEDDLQRTLSSGSPLLTDKERRAILNDKSSRLLRKYLNVAYIFDHNRFRLIGLQENLKKLSVMIAGYCYIWELSENCASFSNSLLDEIRSSSIGEQDREALKGLIVRNGKGWHRYAKILPVEGSDPLRLELDTKTIRKIIADIVSDYRVGFGMAKAAAIASKEFVEENDAEEFIPVDIKEALDFVNKPNTYVPNIYRYDEYERLLKEKGAEDIEVKIAAKYAVLPSYDMIEPIGLDVYRDLFKTL